MVVDTGRTGSTNLVNYLNARWDQYSLIAEIDVCCMGLYWAAKMNRDRGTYSYIFDARIGKFNGTNKSIWTSKLMDLL